MPCRLMRQPCRLLRYLHWCLRPDFLLQWFVTYLGLPHCLSGCRWSDCCRSGLLRRQISRCLCIHFCSPKPHGRAFPDTAHSQTDRDLSCHPQTLEAVWRPFSQNICRVIQKSVCPCSPSACSQVFPYLRCPYGLLAHRARARSVWSLKSCKAPV